MTTLHRPDRFNQASARSCVYSFVRVLAFMVFGLGLIWSQPSAAQKRDAELEWEAVPDVSRYEIEVRALSVANSKPLLFKTKSPAWKGRLRHGKYSLRIRVYDERGVPSLWGEPSEFWVRLLPPEKTTPKTSQSIASKSEETESILFSWAAVPGATAYRLEIFADKSSLANEKPLITRDTPTTQLNVPVSVAKSYIWRVRVIMEENELGEADKSDATFTVNGTKLSSPEIIDPGTDFVRDLSWTKPSKSETFTYSLERAMPKGKWKTFEKKTAFPETKIPFNEKYPGGRWRLRVQSTAALRPSSAIATHEFNVRDGDRSEEAANLARLRESLDQPAKFYFITSYFVTNIQYSGIVRERATAVNFNAVGGTGRVGLGYVFPQTPWSTFAVVDLSGFNIKGQTSTFASAELHAVWRRHWNVSLLRASGGLFYKELPEASGFALGGTGDVDVSKLSSFGPHVGFEFLHPFTYKVGLQLNARAYMSVAGSTPNGEALKPQASYQFSVLGSYRLGRETVGFAGYSYRKDNGAYAARPGDPNDPSSGAANAGDENSISITGHYLNLILEYAF